MTDAITLQPIGIVRAGRSEPIDDAWDSVPASIELDRALPADATAGLDAFSHLEVIYFFHRVPESEITTGARHPRGRTDWPKIGIFSQRGKGRPNRLGATICRLVSIEPYRIVVQGLDAIDGTPVLDLKPWMSGFAPRGAVREPAWATELMREYW